MSFIEHIVEQGSDEWFELRAGIITSSKVSAIMAVRGIGKGAETLAKDLAWEAVFGYEENSFDNFDLQRGRELEPLAFEEAQKKYASDFIDLRKAGFGVKDYLKTGSSPDGVFSNNKGYEAKCPRLPKLRDILIGEIENPEYEYFHQMQHQMLVWGFESVIFHNFGVYLGRSFNHFVEVSRCEKTIQTMEERLALFNPLLQKYINEFKKLK